VTNLEKSNADQPTILVVDSMALLQDLHMVRRVAGYKKFKMVVPQVVIRELDNIKKQDK
jgi:rRNA-processing protein FCF1